MNRKPARGRPAVPSELELGMQVSELPKEGRAGQRPRRLLMNGVVVMAGAALLSKLIGVFQKIPLQNMAGDRVFGIYNAVYPFYQLAAVLATAGLPTAVSLLIAERLRKDKDSEGVRRTLYAALLLLGITGIAAFGWMWIGSDQVSRWIGDSETASSIRAVSVALLLAPVVAALRGYAQGLGRMTLSATSQVIEQMIRVAIMLFVLAMSWSAGWADASVAAGVMSGSAFGASASLIVLAVYFWRKRRRERLVRAPGAVKAELKKLAAIAVPVALGAVVVPAIGVVDAFTVPRLLRDGGLSEAEAMAMFGIYSRAQPLVQLVVMVAGAAAAALVPGLALARMRGAYGQLRVQLSVAERAAWAIGAAASIGLVLLAEPMNVMLYADAKGTAAFALVGCTALAGSVNAVTAPVLQGLGAVRTPAVLLLIAALLKGALNAVLVPSYGVEGAAAAGVAALSAAAVLGAVAVRRAAASAGASLDAGWAAAGQSRRAEQVPSRARERRSESASMRDKQEHGSELVSRRDKQEHGSELVRERDKREQVSESARERDKREQVSGSVSERELDERDQVSGSVSERELDERDQVSGSASRRELDEREHRSGSARERELDEREQVSESAREREQVRRPALGRAAAGTALALAVMAAALVVAERALGAALGGLLPPRAAAAALALTGVAVGACAFGAAALRGGAISARELRALPGGGVLAARLRRWRLIPPAEQEE